MERWRSDQWTGRKGSFSGAFASEKVEKVVTTPRGVGTHPPTTGKTAVRPTATAKYPATAAMAVWSVVSAGSSMVPPARRPEVVTHALFGKFIRAHFSSVPRFELIFFSASLIGQPYFSLWLKSTVGQLRCELESNSERVGRPRVLADVTVEGARGTRRHDGRLREPSADPHVIAGV